MSNPGDFQRARSRTTRRAVHEAKVAFSLGQVRVHLPRVTELGMWLQYDFGDGRGIDGRKTVPFCAWMAGLVPVPGPKGTAEGSSGGVARLPGLAHLAPFELCPFLRPRWESLPPAPPGHTPRAGKRSPR